METLIWQFEGFEDSVSNFGNQGNLFELTKSGLVIEEDWKILWVGIRKFRNFFFEIEAIVGNQDFLK